ncbi:hypothetical protein V8E53_001728 [Lactarius tabidus]
MSHPNENFNVPNPEIGVDRHPPQSAQNQASHDVSNFVDGSGHILSMYLEMATEEDKKIVENWKADADGILIFTGLFSAVVASFISVSIQDIQENPQDTSNFYLANIYQTLADPNSSNISSLPPASPPPFSPPNSAVWVNALWFLSLVISLTCALLATLLQQWARRYLKITQSRYSPHKRARIRAFFAEGVEKCLLPWTVETLPTLLHLSLFLFFAGLVVFLCNVNFTIFKLVLSWVGLCTTLYGCITCMPIIRHDSPYRTPLSLPAWHIVTGMLFSVYVFLRWFNESVRLRSSSYLRFRYLQGNCRKSLVQGMQKTIEETALNSPSEIDTRAFVWTFDCLDEDHELEQFFSSLPGFRSSNVVHDPLPSLTEEQKWKFYEAFDGLLDRTFSSDLLPVPVKNRRAMICAKAVDPIYTPDAVSVLNKILFNYRYSGPMATGIATILRGWGKNMVEDDILYAQAIIAKVIARYPQDDSWYILASNELGVPSTLLQDYAGHGDSLLLVILIHVVHQQFIHFRKSSWPQHVLSPVLAAASKFNIKDTSPELQHKFCALWNQIVIEVQESNDWLMAFRILGPIRRLYLSLHQDTESAPTRFSVSTYNHDPRLRESTSYPLCNFPGHHSDLTPNVHASSAFATLARTYAHACHKTAPVPSPSFTCSPVPTSASAHAPFRIHECLTNAPLLVDNTSVPIHARITTETCSSLSNPVPTCATLGGVDTSPKVTHLPTPEPSTPATPNKSNTSISPSHTVTVDHVAVSLTHSSDLEVPSSSSPSPVLDNLSLIDSHSPMLAPAASGPSRSCDPGAAPDGDEYTKAALSIAPDVQSRLLRLQSISDVASAGLSQTSSPNSLDTGSKDPSRPHG